MVVRVRLIGKGTPEDPFRFPLPTYVTHLQLHDQGIGFAAIPDEDHPNLEEHDSAQFERSSVGPILVTLDSEGHSRWYRHLDTRYAEHKGDFRPEIA